MHRGVFVNPAKPDVLPSRARERADAFPGPVEQVPLAPLGMK
jgi:hypothetical protein